MRSFIAYWYEHKNEMGNCLPFECVTTSDGVEHHEIFPRSKIINAMPFIEGVLFLLFNEKENTKHKSFVPWHQISGIDFEDKKIDGTI